LGRCSAWAVHPALPLMASGSRMQFVKTYTLGGEALGLIRYHDGFLGQRIGRCWPWPSTRCGPCLRRAPPTA
ncbi:unnamed protein product, partial [Heterosigma akashiwo]